MKRVAIIIPAYNEEKRIGATLHAYLAYFAALKNQVSAEFIVVLNGCTDTTHQIVHSIAHENAALQIISMVQAGKGLAVAQGFKAALAQQPAFDLIGFVDADMATQPRYFHDLLEQLGDRDGIIASRYMPGATVYPRRPWIKRVGSLLLYDSLVTALFGMRYHDVQCGAKVFKRNVIETIIAYLHVRQWSFDVELLYLCKRFGFTISEHPTVWYDQTGSKLSIMRDGLRMPWSLIKLRIRHVRLTK